jgi:hypothetical protein
MPRISISILITLTTLVLIGGFGEVSHAGPMTPEISGSWGWMWGGSADSWQGKLRLDSSSNFGATLGVPVAFLSWGEAQYTYQSTAMTLDGFGTRQNLTNMDVHFFQLAATRGVKDGPVVPYVLGGIGTTWFNPAQSVISIDGTLYNLDSSWKLSFVLGLGVKVWLGEAEKVGLRLQFRTLPTLYNSSGGIWVGGGGAAVSISGNAVWQFDVSAGVTVKLGG